MQSLTTNFEFKYQGKSDSIDINTLLTSQFHYTAILDEIRSQLFPEVEIKIRIQSFERGSFDINQLIEITTISGILIFENVDYLSRIFNVLKSYLEIKKVLSNTKPEKIEENEKSVILTIEGNNNTVIIDKDAFNIYKKNQVMHNALTKNAEILSNDEQIEGVIITNTSEGKEIVNIPRKEFASLSTDNPYLCNEKNEKIMDDAFLYVHKPELSSDKNSKWDFIYDGRKIKSVTIKDEFFLKKVGEGIKFGKGDRLSAKLKIHQKLDSETGAYLDNKYEILKVHEIIPKPEQGRLYDN